jgi:hypothetical protein
MKSKKIRDCKGLGMGRVGSKVEHGMERRV